MREMQIMEAQIARVMIDDFNQVQTIAGKALAASKSPSILCVTVPRIRIRMQTWKSPDRDLSVLPLLRN